MWGSAVQVCSGLPLKRWKSEKVKKGKKHSLNPFNFSTFQLHSGGLAQLARAPALQAGGQRFESVILHIAHQALSYIIYDLSFSEAQAIFDILKAKAKCKANLRVIYFKMYDVV